MKYRFSTGWALLYHLHLTTSPIPSLSRSQLSSTLPNPVVNPQVSPYLIYCQHWTLILPWNIFLHLISIVVFLIFLLLPWLPCFTLLYCVLLCFLTFRTQSLTASSLPKSHSFNTWCLLNVDLLSRPLPWKCPSHSHLSTHAPHLEVQASQTFHLQCWTPSTPFQTGSSP